MGLFLPIFCSIETSVNVSLRPSWPSLENISPELKTVLPNADFVIEGYVDPHEPLRDEGPFGDHTGYYTLPEPYPVFDVTAVTHRKDAVYRATIVGIPPMKDFCIGGACLKRGILNPLAARMALP
jgi:UbiD family decarboxylase